MNSRDKSMDQQIFSDTEEAWLPFCHLNLCKSSDQELCKGTIKQSGTILTNQFLIPFTNVSTGHTKVITFENLCPCKIVFKLENLLWLGFCHLQRSQEAAQGLGHSKLDLFSSSTALRFPEGTAFCFYSCPGCHSFATWGSLLSHQCLVCTLLVNAGRCQRLQ